MGWRAEGRALARGRPSSGPVQEQAGALERRREERATERWAGAPEGRERGGSAAGLASRPGRLLGLEHEGGRELG